LPGIQVPPPGGFVRKKPDDISSTSGGLRGGRGRPPDTSRDQELLDLRNAGHSYRELREQFGFKGAESTVRGRYRNLMKKAREERVRNGEDVEEERDRRRVYPEISDGPPLNTEPDRRRVSPEITGVLPIDPELVVPKERAESMFFVAPKQLDLTLPTAQATADDEEDFARPAPEWQVSLDKENELLLNELLEEDAVSPDRANQLPSAVFDEEDLAGEDE
jgi:hypothetical protein